MGLIHPQKTPAQSFEINHTENNHAYLLFQKHHVEYSKRDLFA